MPLVSRVDLVLGAFDAVVTVEGSSGAEIQRAVERIARTPGVKEAKPLIETRASGHPKARPVIGARR